MITEIATLHDALKKISYNTSVILDLDNTVMESMLEVGGDQWFTSLMSHMDVGRLDIASIIAIYHSVQDHIRVKPVESPIVIVIRALQDIGIPVIALTARDYSIRHPTIRQLNDIGIDFSRNLPATEAKNFQDGIIFCDGADKGTVLKNFLNDFCNLPAHLVMLDDKKKHLEHVQHALESLSIPFDGLRYGFLDEKVTRFDKRLATHQFALIKARLPATVQEIIDRHELIPADHAVGYTSSHYMHGFFKEAHTAQSAPIAAPIPAASAGAGGAVGTLP